MRKTTLLIASLSLLFSVACNNNSKSSETDQATTPIESQDLEELTEEPMAVWENSWINEIESDNGNKWEANPETNEGVANMLALMADAKTETLEDYKSLGEKLNVEKNYIIKECTMEGPSHDNLHVFLHPLIDKIDALLVSESTDEAEVIMSSIQENVAKYSDYFE